MLYTAILSVRLTVRLSVAWTALKRLHHDHLSHNSSIIVVGYAVKRHIQGHLKIDIVDFKFNYGCIS